jgi:SAM-dependent methyltransferase
MWVPLVCPNCRARLDEGPSGWRCPVCGRAYPADRGVPRFVEADPFYEGRWARPDFSRGSLRNWLVKKERFFLRRLRGRRGVLLDLGCGGGWAVFGAVGHAVGLDVSVTSLLAARQLYPQVVCASLDALPFPDEAFDFVVSSDVLGHVPLEAKDRVLAEIWRVLKPGGRTLHYIEADGADPALRFARRYPELFRRHIIEPEGHIGLETPAQIFKRFRAAGFRPLAELPVYRGLLYWGRVRQYFDNDYRGKSFWVDRWVDLARVLTAHPLLELGGNVLVALALEVGDRVFPPEWAGGVLVDYVKGG